MSVFIRLHSADDVVIARSQLMSGASVEDVPVKGLIPPGHKVATRATQAGQPVRRYNQIIGFASAAIQPGEHVHTHNLNMGPEKGNFERDYAIGQDVKPEAPRKHATFMGIKRWDGRVATRNYIGVLSSVNCSATAARAHSSWHTCSLQLLCMLSLAHSSNKHALPRALLQRHSKAAGGRVWSD